MAQTALFDIDEYKDSRICTLKNEKRCKTCIHCIRHTFNGRQIFISCDLLTFGKKNKRVKASNPACLRYNEQPPTQEKESIDHGY